MCVCVLLGTPATHSKENLMEWLDALVLSVTASDVRVYDHRRQRLYGIFAGLRQHKCMKVISLDLLSGLDEWLAEYVQNHYSCGTLLMTTLAARGSTSCHPILCGPFQKCY